MKLIFWSILPTIILLLFLILQVESSRAQECWIDPETGQQLCISATALPTLTPTAVVAPTPGVGPYREVFLPLILK